MPTYSLDITNEEHFDFDVFSIGCNDTIYRVIHELNTGLSIDLQLQDLLEYKHKEGEDFYFPLYSCSHEELNMEFHLIPNQTSFQPYEKHKPYVVDLFGGDIEQVTKLIPELENTDYFLLIKGDNRYLYSFTILETIRQIPSFSAVQEVFIDDLKDKKAKGNLLF